MINVDLLETVLKLMAQHRIDEIACEEFTIKKSLHENIKHVFTPQEILAAHAPEPTDEEFFAAIPQDAVEQWSQQGGK